jgi:hypothetical protein
MLDNEAEHEPDGEETEEHNLEDFWKKYPWRLIGHESRGSATSPEKAKAGDTVTLFEGKNTRV